MYSSIVLAVDLEQPASWSQAMPVCQSLARCFGARLTLCSVVPDTSAIVTAEWSAIGYREMLEVTEARLKTLAATVDAEIGAEIGTGSVWQGVLDVAGRIGADLIVLASHKPVMKDYLLGANASRVVRHARCSVLVVRDSA